MIAKAKNYAGVEVSKNFAFGYVRVSDITQVQTGLSLEKQEEQIDAYITYICTKYPGLKFGGHFIDKAESAYKKDLNCREAGLALWNRVERGDHVIFAKLDRGFRRARDTLAVYEHWERLGVTMHILNAGGEIAGATAKAFITVLSAMAELESAFKSERVKDAMNVLKSRGQLLGQAPYGWQYVGRGARRRKVPHDMERLTMRLIVHLKDVEGMDGKTIQGYLYKHKLRLHRRHSQRKGFGHSLARIYRLYNAAKELGLEPSKVLIEPIMPEANGHVNGELNGP